MAMLSIRLSLLLLFTLVPEVVSGDVNVNIDSSSSSSSLDIDSNSAAVEGDGNNIDDVDNSTTMKPPTCNVKESSTMTIQDHVQKQIDWIRSKELGYVSKNIHYFNIMNNVDENDKDDDDDDGITSMIQFVAKEDIEEGETLIVIPNSCLLKTRTKTLHTVPDADDDDEDLEATLKAFNDERIICDSVHNIALQYMLGQQEEGEGKSEYTPYVDYCLDSMASSSCSPNSRLQQQLAKPTPSTWSEPAQELLESILGLELFPDLAIDDVEDGSSQMTNPQDTYYNYEILCGDYSRKFDNEDNPASPPIEVLQKAFEYYHSHSVRHTSSSDNDDGVTMMMVPLLDIMMFKNGDDDSHKKEGKSSNLGYYKHDIREGLEDVTVYAKRHIQKGEQLRLQYNDEGMNDRESLLHCHTCGVLGMYSTHHVLRDYGYIQHYPTRWNFYDSGMVFHLTEVDPEEKTEVDEEDEDDDEEEEEEGFSDEDGDDDEEDDEDDEDEDEDDDDDDDEDNDSESEEEEEEGDEEDDNDGGTPLFEKKLEFHWIKSPWGKPKDIAKREMAFFFGHLSRLQHMNVEEAVLSLSDDHERTTILEFYNSLTEAIQYLIWFLQDKEMARRIRRHHRHLYKEKEKGPVLMSMSKPHRDHHHVALNDYDKLDDDGEWSVPFGDPVCINEGKPFWENYGDFDWMERMKSSYQEIDFLYNPKTDDTCLHLSDLIHSCQSNRPHFHEMITHYPASYIANVKRVMFIGGGDNKIINEILKYEPLDLELVVGMELDKKISEASFKIFETQPHFDNDKVEWWYGDARKTLYLLPQEYYGTFDLILLDLQPEISDSQNFIDRLFVFAKKENSIIMRNEDGRFGTNSPYAKYHADLYLDDMPYFCRQGMTMGSNSIDFVRAPRTKHNISTHYFDTSFPIKHEKWYNYRNDEGLPTSKIAQQNHVEEEGEQGIASSGTEQSFESLKSSVLGVLMVLELEQITTLPQDVNVIFTALQQVGFTLQSSDIVVSSENPDSADPLNTTVYIMDEGYIVSRLFPNKNYCAVDVMLWDRYDKLPALKDFLARTLGSGVTSAFRLINVNSDTGGNTGGDDDDDKDDDKNDEMEDSEEPSLVCNNESIRKAAEPTNQEDTNTVMKASLTTLLSHKDSPELMVLCGEKSQPCHALEVAREIISPSSVTKPIAIYACPPSQSKSACEAPVHKLIADLIEDSTKLDSIVFDSQAPKALGQILNKILRNPELRGRLLSDKFVAVGTASSSDVDSDSSTRRSSWLSAFMERFRTDFIPYHPSFHAEVVFEKEAMEEEDVPQCQEVVSSSLVVSIYSSGNPNFYSDFAQLVASAEEQTNLPSYTRYVKTGKNPYHAEYNGLKTATTHEDYDPRPAREQWKSQHPLGRQTMAQFHVKWDKPSEFPNMLRQGFQLTLALMNDEGYITTNQPTIKYSQFAGVNNDIMVVALWEDCSAVAIYDGNTQLTLNLFTRNQDEIVHAKFIQNMKEKTISADCITEDAKGHKCKPCIKPKIVNTHPRGTGRVIMFPEKEYTRDQLIERMATPEEE